MAFRFLHNPSPLLFLSFISLLLPSHASDTLSPATPLADGETLVFSGGIFELGFFTPRRLHQPLRRHLVPQLLHLHRPLGRQPPNPPSLSSASLLIGPDVNLLVRASATNTLIWSSNASLPSNQSTAQLTDTGNFVLNSSGTVSWQRFNHPTDTYLPGMKVGLNLRTNVDQLFRSWRSDDDPAEGKFSIGIEPKLSTQIFIWEGTAPRWRSGRWNGQVFIGIQNMVPQ